VTVLTARPNYPDYRVLDEYRTGRHDESVIEGVRIERVSTWAPGKDSSWRRVRHELWLLLSMTIALLRGRVGRHSNVVSFCPSIFMVLAGALAKRGGGNHVAVVHDVQSGLASGLGMAGHGAVGLIRALERFALNRADVVLVLSAEMKRQIESLGVSTRLEILPLWIDTDKVYPLPGRANDPPIVAYSGNLGRKQGLDQVLSLAEVLRDRRPDVRIVVRGQGSQSERLQHEARERQLTNVEFCPLIPEEQLNEALAEADVHLVPQLPGGADSAVPSKAYTIMAAGRPFICTTEAGSTLWALNNETEAFVCSPPNEPQAMADALLSLIDSPEAREEMGTRGRRYIESNLKRDDLLSRLAALLC
jgi:colanic acid biosynthesis glycosyl transferase WcaI